MSHVIKHEACPVCRKNGRDRSGDNLARYSDGGAYCFCCGYFEQGSKFIHHFKNEPRNTETITIPTDSRHDLPERCREFLEQYGIGEFDIQRNYIVWSPSYERLIFPIFVNGNLEAWQGRYFGEEKKSKWFYKGDLNNLFYTIGNPYAKKLVLVEDIISAIRISHCSDFLAMPIFGSHISQKRLLTIKRFYGMPVIIWLDNDKKKEAISFAHTANSFEINTQTVITEKDPKAVHFLDEINAPLIWSYILMVY